MRLCMATQPYGFVDENKLAEQWTKIYTMKTTLKCLTKSPKLNKIGKYFIKNNYNEISLKRQ